MSSYSHAAPQSGHASGASSPRPSPQTMTTGGRARHVSQAASSSGAPSSNLRNLSSKAIPFISVLFVTLFEGLKAADDLVLLLDLAFLFYGPYEGVQDLVSDGRAPPVLVAGEHVVCKRGESGLDVAQLPIRFASSPAGCVAPSLFGAGGVVLVAKLPLNYGRTPASIPLCSGTSGH